MTKHHKILLSLTIVCISTVMINGMDPDKEALATQIMNKPENKEIYNNWDEFIEDVQNIKNQNLREKKETTNTNNAETQLMAQFNALLNFGNEEKI
jgi:hypothetical protein